MGRIDWVISPNLFEEIKRMVFLGLALLSLLIWLFLLRFWGGFWRCQPVLEQGQRSPLIAPFPRICAVVPARNEAELLPVTLRSLLLQDYPGSLQVILVDDHSTDGTAQVARETALAANRSEALTLLAAEPLPPGWSGKLWAMQQGIQSAQAQQPDYLLLTDADIEHDPANLRSLVEQATQAGLDLASVMVRLRCQSLWEKWLIPAFVFFFQKLYPFAWVNHPRRPIAGAAGGCILIRRTALERMGGLTTIRAALIDDCALATAIKLGGSPSHQNQPFAPIWLGLSDRTRSLRPYDTLATIWEMVARTAYTQLHYSPVWLVGTLVGMTLVYLLPPLAALVGLLTGDLWLAMTGSAGYGLMTIAYWPTLRFYRNHPVYSVCLPAIALLYTLMTLDSARRYWLGKGGAWKGRVYSSENS